MRRDNKMKLMYIVVALCALSFMAGFGICKSWAAEDHHQDLNIKDVISEGEGCPVKQMHADKDLRAYIIYYQKGDFTYDTTDEAFDQINAVKRHFADKGIPDSRIVIGVSSMPEWHDGIMFTEGDGIYIILK